MDTDTNTDSELMVSFTRDELVRLQTALAFFVDQREGVQSQDTMERYSHLWEKVRKAREDWDNWEKIKEEMNDG